jgi:hypothetical protein
LFRLGFGSGRFQKSDPVPVKNHPDPRNCIKNNLAYFHSGVIDTAVLLNKVCIAESAVYCDTAVQPIFSNNCGQNHSRISSRIRSHIQKGLNSWIRAPVEIVWWKKTRGWKSRHTVPLSPHLLGSAESQELIFVKATLDRLNKKSQESADWSQCRVSKWLDLLNKKSHKSV